MINMRYAEYVTGTQILTAISSETVGGYNLGGDITPADSSGSFVNFSGGRITS